jgi:hypothetical protein
MSKKDKKRIAELERGVLILSKRIKNLSIQQVTLRDNFILHLLEEHSQIFEQGSIPQSEPKQPETAKDSPTRDGAKLDNSEQSCCIRLGRNWGKSGAGMFKSMFEGQDKTKCAGYCEGENVLPKFDKLRGGVNCNNTRQPDPTLDKSEQEKPAQTEPITPEKEQELMAQLNKELAKFASLEAFNADRKSFFLPPVGKLEFDKAKSCFDYALAAAKVLRPQWYDQINQIKIPKSEQPEAEPKQGSDGADSPKKGSFIKGVFKGKSVNFDADELDAKLRELEALPLKSEYEAAEQTKAAIEQMQQDSPKKEPTFQSQLDQYHAELSDKVISEMNKTMEFWAGVFGLQASKQDETKQPEINHYDPAKATLNKMVLSHVGEMKLWLSLREHNTTEIAQAIQILVDDLGLHLADFRRKVLDLGRVKPCKVEPKETVQCEEKQQEEAQIWAVYNSETNRWLRRVLNDAYWQPENAERSGFGSKEIAEGNIKWLHENGTLRAKIEHCKAVLIAPKKSERGEEKQPKTDQPSPEKDSEKLGEADGADSPTWKVWIVKTNPNYSDRFAPFYLEYVDKNNVVCHTPNAKDAMKFPTELEAKSFLNKLISDCSARYIPDNFGLRELDSNGIVTPKY